MKGVDAISSRKVEGATVYSGSGQKLGSIDELMIDKRSGQVCCAVLESGRFLGIGTERHALPWDWLTYDVTRAAYIVPIDREQFLRIPRYTNADTADYTPECTRPFNDHHGAPW
jgi:sporulation protein YlmC with PRC-barrel domain